MTFVEPYERKIVKILRTDFIIIPFASDGSVDQKEYDRRSLLGINMVESAVSSMDRNVLNLRFCRKVAFSRIWESVTR